MKRSRPIAVCALRLTALGVLVSCLGCVATAGAEVVAPAEPVVAGNSSGMLAAAWTRVGEPYSRGIERVMLSVRPAGGEWSAPVAVSQPHVGAQGPKVAITDRGDVLVSWVIREVIARGRVDEYAYTTASRWRMADGRLAPPHVLRSSRNTVGYRAGTLTPTPAGDVIGEEPGGLSLARPGAELGSPRQIPELPCGAETPVFGPDASMLVPGWQTQPEPQRCTPRLLIVASDGRRRPVDLPVPRAPAVWFSRLQAAPRGGGGAILSWIQQSHVQYALVTADGQITAMGQLPFDPPDFATVVAQSELPGGRTGFLVTDGTTARSAIALYVREPDGSFAEPQIFARGWEGSLIVNGALRPDGRALVAWSPFGGHAQLRVRNADGSVLERELSNGGSEAPAVSLTDATSAVVWPDGQALTALHDGRLSQLDNRRDVPRPWIDQRPFGPHVPAIGPHARLTGRTLRLHARCRAFLPCIARLTLRTGDRVLLRKRIHVAQTTRARTLRLRLPRQVARQLRHHHLATLRLDAHRNKLGRHATTLVRLHPD